MSSKLDVRGCILSPMLKTNNKEKNMLTCCINEQLNYVTEYLTEYLSRGVGLASEALIDTPALTLCNSLRSVHLALHTDFNLQKACFLCTKQIQHVQAP